MSAPTAPDPTADETVGAPGEPPERGAATSVLAPDPTAERPPGVPRRGGDRLDVVLHGTLARHPPRARHVVVRLGALRPGHVAALAFRRPLRDVDGTQSVRRPHLVRAPRARPAVLDRSRGVDHVHRAVGSDRRRSHSGVPLRTQAPRVGVARVDRCRHLPAASCRRLDEPRELPPRLVSRRVHRLRHLRSARTQVAAVRGLRGAVVAGQGGRVARDRAARHLGGAATRPPDRAADRLREHRLHGGRDVARHAQPHRRADAGTDGASRSAVREGWSRRR